MASTTVLEFSTGTISASLIMPLLPEATSGEQHVTGNTTTREGTGAIIVWTATLLLGVTGLTLNGALLFAVVYLTKKRHRASHVVLGNLCVVDLLICVVYFPLLAVSVDSCSQLCNWIVPIERGLVASLTWSTAFMSLDRYLFIVKHAAYRAKMTPKRTALGLGSTWAISSTFAVVSFAFIPDHQEEPAEGHCLCLVARHYSGFYSLLYSACFIVICFILPSTFTVVFYGFIIKAAYKHFAPRGGRKTRQHSVNETLGGAPYTSAILDALRVSRPLTLVVPQVNLYQIKTAKILFLVLGVYFALVVPYFVVNLTLSDGSYIESQDVDLYFAYATCSLLLFATSASNPICYGFCSRRYRDSIMGLTRRWRRRTVRTELARWRASTASGLCVMADGSSETRSRSPASTASNRSEVSAVFQGGCIGRDPLSHSLDVVPNTAAKTSSSGANLRELATRPVADILLCDTVASVPGKLSQGEGNSDPTDVIRKPLGGSSTLLSNDTTCGRRPTLLPEPKSSDNPLSVQRPT